MSDHTIMVHFSSVAHSCPTLCDLMDCCTPGFPVHHQLPEHPQAISTNSVMPSNHFILCHPFILPSIFPTIRVSSFPMSQFFTSGGQNIGVSALASVLPMNSQDWFSLGLTGLISFQSKGLSRRVFSNTTVGLANDQGFLSFSL